MVSIIIYAIITLLMDRTILYQLMIILAIENLGRKLLRGVQAGWQLITVIFPREL